MLNNYGSGVPSPDLAGVANIDALIVATNKMIAKQGKIARRSIIKSKKAMRLQARQGRAEMDLLRQQIDALNVQPPPEISTPNNAEVQLARRQAAIDASQRTGVRRSIIAGETGRFSGSAGMPPRKSILG